MAYMNRESRRASIIDAAVTIILSEGLGAATVRAVANALGASPGHIHHHFLSADELRAEAFRLLWSRVAPEFAERIASLPPRERLLAALLGDDPEIEALTARLWNEALVASVAEPLIREAVRETMEQWLELLVATIDAGLKSGDFASALPAPEVARRLASYCLGIDIMASLGIPAHATEEQRDRVGDYVDMQLAPVTQPKGRRPA